MVVVDDEDRENEGDLIMPADTMTPEAMAFLVQHSTGIVCVGMKGEMLDRLQIPLMVPDKDNEEALLTAFTVTVVNYFMLYLLWLPPFERELIALSFLSAVTCYSFGSGTYIS